MRTYIKTVASTREALQYTGDNLHELVEEGLPMPVTIDDAFNIHVKVGWFQRFTLRPGDYLVRDGSRFSAMGQDSFDKNFKAVSQG